MKCQCKCRCTIERMKQIREELHSIGQRYIALATNTPPNRTDVLIEQTIKLTDELIRLSKECNC